MYSDIFQLEFIKENNFSNQINKDKIKKYENLKMIIN